MSLLALGKAYETAPSTIARCIGADRVATASGRAGMPRGRAARSKPLAPRLVGRLDLRRATARWLGLAVSGSRASLGELCLVEPPGKPIFNGNDLDG